MVTKWVYSWSSIFCRNKHYTKLILFNHVHKTICTDTPVKEIRIPVKWGHIAAKLWGNENQKPILALHGWQDNAGTWDPLAQSLCKKISILAIDFPGHGLSSWFPEGIYYYPWGIIPIVLHIKEYFQWEKVSLLGHSISSVASLRFASVFPDDVDFCIGIDNLVYEDVDIFATYLSKMTKMKKDIQEEETVATKYTIDELITMWHLGSKKSVKKENVKYLLQRGAKPSNEPNKYYFSRDPKIKVTLASVEDECFLESLVQRLKCPFLHIKASDTPFGYEENSIKMKEVIAQNNINFESHILPGTHHVHLNSPELVEHYILNFLKAHQFVK